MIRLNVNCEGHVWYFPLIFVMDMVPSFVTIQWDLTKYTCYLKHDVTRPPKKNISCLTQKHVFWKRPSTDFDKNHIFGISSTSAIEWHMSCLLSMKWPSDEPWGELIWERIGMVDRLYHLNGCGITILLGNFCCLALYCVASILSHGRYLNYA